MAACFDAGSAANGSALSLLLLSAHVHAEQSPKNNVGRPVQTRSSTPLTRTRFPVTQNVSLPTDDISMSTIIKALYGPILHPIDAANFTDEEGDVYRLNSDPKFREKLGKRVLILDIDSRPLTGKGQLMNSDLKWNDMRPLSAGMLSHFMYGESFLYRLVSLTV